MGKTNEQVIKAFVDGKSAKAGALWTDGDNLWSYKYLLAWHHNQLGQIRYNLEPTGIMLQTQSGNRRYDAAFSPTTSTHRRLLIAELDRQGYDTHGAEPVERDVVEYRKGDRIREFAERYGRDEDGIYQGEIEG